MRIIIISIFLIFLSGCFWRGGVKYTTPPPPPNSPPVKYEPIDFTVVDVNNDGNITKKEAESFNKILEKPNPSYDYHETLHYFLIIMGAMTVACCAPWACRKMREQWKK